MNVAVAKILALMGNVVLVPNRPLTKKPIARGWQLRTRESMKDPAYLDSFEGKNIGISLGEASGGLCTIDLDTSAAVDEFLANNPKLSNTTRTSRVRGCNLWIFVDGKYPPNSVLNKDGKPFGEWRADGNQTVIWGRAIDRKKGEAEPTQYRFLNEVPPIRIRFEEIVFPDGCFDSQSHTTHTPLRLHPESCIPASCAPASCIPASLHNISTVESVMGNIKARNHGLHTLAKTFPGNPDMVNLYNRLVASRFSPEPQTRNHFITQAVPFLYHAVAPLVLLSFVSCFYDCNRALFKDSRDQHVNEAQAMLQAVSRTYLESLPADQQGLYMALDEREQDGFRICRDLALLAEPPREPYTFFLSFNHLADRLAIHPPQAQRLMRQLAGYGLITQLKKGKRRIGNEPAESGIYKWLLPTEKKSENP